MAAGVCLVVPTYNEKENVAPLVQAVKALGDPQLSLLFVDDSSPDGTGDLIREAASREPWVSLLSREGKKGIGSAYQEGFKVALESKSPEVVVEMDADLQHPPSKIPELAAAVRNGAGVAVASRY
ncbi:MAG TPA: glycosyltransferase, partial [Nitrososphaerales archaeon]|nr:glycosyltransferase [Nitrososphaerales archaeon]